MLAQIYLRKGTVVPKHVHESEQITYILAGTLRLTLGDDGAEVHDVAAGEVLVISSKVPQWCQWPVGSGLSWAAGPTAIRAYPIIRIPAAPERG